MQAILSDIHGNLEALQAVLMDVTRFPVTAIHCLGDAIGYGPNPRECFDFAVTLATYLRGDWEDAVLNPIAATPLLPSAKRHIESARDELLADVPDKGDGARRFAQLETLQPARVLSSDTEFFHGSPRNPLHDYVFPEDQYNSKKLEQIFGAFQHRCFVGHSHLPMILSRESRHAHIEYRTPEPNQPEQLVGAQVLCNVGSVGQPRDGDQRACYVLLDGDTCWFRRVPYDVDLTIEKLRKLG